ncbi:MULTISPECIES: phage holin family protein [unclassified Crossiella]|uniref:phage holin family protein n=1 Tax=unclassified Crossiella TaxID=2620835 RepID=UPI00207D6CEE|nr:MULTISPECIES: phage holin family protein [unclassified Crossiella]MCO1576579.1 phage holin family protein [Crossiella sp. SN42]WHT17963.1 phage holin family protein [Crossiella sp. CA-258035]
MFFVLQVVITAVALWVSTALPGIDIGPGPVSVGAKIGTLLLVGLVFGLVNAIIKPVVKLVGCVFYLLTLGLIGLVVNGLLFWLTGWAAGKLGLPFEVTGFWPAFFGAIIVAVVSWALNAVLQAREAVED